LASQETLRILWIRRVYNLVQKTPSVVPVLSKMSVPFYLIKNLFNRKGNLPSNFPAKITKTILFPVMHNTFPVYLIPVYLIILMEFSDDQNSWSLSVCNFPAPFYFLALSYKHFPQISATRLLQLRVFLVCYRLKFICTCKSFQILPINFIYCLNMTDRSLYPYNKRGRIINLCIIIYNFLDKPQNKGFETSSSKQSPDFLCFQILLEWWFILLASFTNTCFEL
jgi:hypothetical protein